MKKFVSIFLALTMIFSLAITALAEESTKLTVTPDQSGVERTYVGHQLLKLESMSLKEGEHHPEDCPNKKDETAEHDENCYHYAYTVVSKYKEILQKEVLAYAGTSFWGNTTQPSSHTLVTDDHILAYLASLTSDDDNGGFGTLRKVADRIYREIKNAGIGSDTEEFTTSTNIEKGYWILEDVTNLGGKEAASSLVIVDTLAKDNIEITPKTSLPTLTKKVQDIEDSENLTIADMLWYDSADHDIGDNVPFKLTATLPSNIQYYTSYTITFHDTLSPALQLTDTNRLTENLTDGSDKSFRVLMYRDLGTANADTDLNAGKDVTGSFTINKAATDCTTNCSFEVTGNIYNIPGIEEELTANTTFVVYYEAELLESAVLGNPGNPNSAYLEFSNNPYDINKTGRTKDDKVVVFTYQFILNKVDQHNHPLKGAEFTLYKMILGEENWKEVAHLKVEDDGTKFIWTGLDDGDYKMVESTVPEGFNGMADRQFTIVATHDLDSDDPKLTYLGTANSPDNGDVVTGAMEETVANRSGAALPETGGMGTMMLIGGGAMFVTVAAVFMVTRKKMSIYED